MITIIHGDDIKTSRNFYIEQKNNSQNPISIDIEKLSLTELIQISEGGSLFFEEKNIFIENFFVKKKKGKESDEIINYLNKNTSLVKVFFWESKELTKTQINLFQKSISKVFKLPKTLFTFLDSIKPGGENRLLLLFHQTLTTCEAELIFFMIIKRFRLLIALSDGDSKETIDELKNLQGWQLSKLTKQASFYSIDKLKKVYKKLYEIDLNNKTGKLPMSLTQAIDIFLLDI